MVGVGAMAVFAALVLGVANVDGAVPETAGFHGDNCIEREIGIEGGRESVVFTNRCGTAMAVVACVLGRPDRRAAGAPPTWTCASNITPTGMTSGGGAGGATPALYRGDRVRAALRPEPLAHAPIDTLTGRPYNTFAVACAAVRLYPTAGPTAGATPAAVAEPVSFGVPRTDVCLRLQNAFLGLVEAPAAEPADPVKAFRRLGYRMARNANPLAGVE